ncbi:MAG: glycoside hydrolase family 6 protein [Oligoflexus sp.]
MSVMDTEEVKTSHAQIRFQEDGVYLKEGSAVVFMSWADLTLVMSEDHQVCFVDGMRRIVVRCSLCQVESDLAAYGMIRINRQVIINLRHVKKIAGGTKARIQLNNGQHYPITRRRKLQVLQAHHGFLQQTCKRKSSTLRTLRRSIDTFGDEKLWTPSQSKVRAYLSRHPDLATDHFEAFQFIAKTPACHWLGAWNNDLMQELRPMLVAADAAREIPVFVIYRLLLRDETKTIQPNLWDLMLYKQWIRSLVQAVGHYKCIIILEPNALSMMDDEMPIEVQDIYYEALRYAIACLRRQSQILIYLDAGHSAWVDPMQMTVRLARAGVDFAHGFAVNVSHFIHLDEIYEYGQTISQILGGKPFVIDTSRNGQGIQDTRQWCNPPGVGLGRMPTLKPRMKGVDAFLWIKPPGESDGGGKNKSTKDGEWLPARAWELIRMAKMS